MGYIAKMNKYTKTTTHIERVRDFSTQRLANFRKFYASWNLHDQNREKNSSHKQKLFVFEYEQKNSLQCARQSVLSDKIVFLICLLSVEEIHLCHFVFREPLYGSSVSKNVILFVHTQKVAWENLLLCTYMIKIA